MKIKFLEQKTPTSYTFSLVVSPFVFKNFWFNTDHGNVVAPFAVIGERRKSYVWAHASTWKRLRDCVRMMVEKGITEYDSERDFMLGFKAEAEEIEPETVEALEDAA